MVRIYPPGRRDDAAPEIDAAVLRLVRGLVPVPDVLEVRRGVAAADRPGLLVTSFLPGERGDLLLPTLDDAAAAGLGATLGELARRPRGHADPASPGRSSTPTCTDRRLRRGRRPARVRRRPRRRPWAGTPDLLAGLAARRRARPRRCSTRVGRTCLVHSDLNPKNLLVDPGTLEVTGRARLGVRPLRPPVHRPRQPAPLRPPAGVRRGRAGGLVRPSRRHARRTRSSWPARPTSGPWSTSRQAWPEPRGGSGPRALVGHRSDTEISTRCRRARKRPLTRRREGATPCWRRMTWT